jgi:uncharacterized membrane protein (DUF106 family)
MQTMQWVYIYHLIHQKHVKSISVPSFPLPLYVHELLQEMYFKDHCQNARPLLYLQLFSPMPLYAYEYILCTMTVLRYNF